MSFIAPIIALGFIVIVATLLLKKWYPHAVLLIAGLLMLIVAWAMDLQLPSLMKSTGSTGLDLFRYIKESFSETNAGVGLMIMAIGGFVAYIDHIGASGALVHLAIKPLSLLKKYPHLSASAVIPIGQVLFVCIPSAAGLGLLLMASVYPILRNIGVSNLSAVSVITACTAFGIGPASAITASAVTIAGEAPVSYFVQHQIPLVIPLSIVVAVAFYFVNRHFDKTEDQKPVDVSKKGSVKAPLIYALIPILPLILLIAFSSLFQLFETPILLDTSTAMFISLFVAIIFELIRKRNFKEVFQSLKVFWNGMGNIFKTVVTLIIAADIFAKGLISLQFIDGLVYVAQHMGLAAIGVGVVMTVMIFLASMLMGSGNASFFAFAPLVPDMAVKLGVKSTSIILPMNLAASMGRTVSPVAGVLIATAEIAEVSTLQIVKRNIIPLGSALVVMLLYHYI
ncbi:C4-dicarboxylate transporter DcuC [Halocola ammonii]